MDYLTAFTGKGGRLLRGTASRLWAAVPGGLRQVRFQDSVSRAVPQPAEPAPGTGGNGAGSGRAGRGTEPCAPPGRAASLLPPGGGAGPERGLSGAGRGSVPAPTREHGREEGRAARCRRLARSFAGRVAEPRRGPAGKRPRAGEWRERAAKGGPRPGAVTPRGGRLGTCPGGAARRCVPAGPRGGGSAAVFAFAHASHAPAWGAADWGRSGRGTGSLGCALSPAQGSSCFPRVSGELAGVL